MSVSGLFDPGTAVFGAGELERIQLGGDTFGDVATQDGDTDQAQLNIFESLPVLARLSVTSDNGAEFHHHYKLADQLDMDTFFADPYSAW